MTTQTNQEEWHHKTLEYAAAINAFVEIGLRDGWENAGVEPTDPGLDHLAEEAIASVRRANADGQLMQLRELWPPAHDPLIKLLKENGQDIPLVCVLPDHSIVARIGALYEFGKTVHIVGDAVQEVNDVAFFGRSPNRKYFGVSKSDGVHILDGWKGARVAMCPWPNGVEGTPEGFNVRPFDSLPTPTRLIPFPDGTRVLLVSSQGIFVLSQTKAVRLLPTVEQLTEYFECDDELVIDLSMEHGAISHDGKFIAVGSQDSTHLIFDENLTLVGNIGNHSEYPDYALFSADDSVVAFNSCHLYNGVTVGVPLSQLPGLKTEPYEDDQRITILEDGARVYAGTTRQDEFIVGDSIGYVRAFSVNGEPRWQLFIGSNVCDMDISNDGKTLVVSTYAGFLSIIKLDAGQQAPYQIGNSKHMEVRRWLFWKNEEKALIW